MPFQCVTKWTHLEQLCHEREHEERDDYAQCYRESCFETASHLTFNLNPG